VVTPATVLAAILGALLAVPPAAADPTSAEAQRQVEELQRKMAVATEQYNEARIALRASTARQAVMVARSRTLRTQVERYAHDVHRFAASAYRGGRIGAFTALLESGSPQTFLDQLATLDHLTRSHRVELDRLVEARRTLAAQQVAVDAEVATQRTQQKVLAGQKAVIERDLSRWTALRSRFLPRSSRSSRDATPSTYTGPASGKAATAIAFAYRQLGKPYRWGAAGPGSYDCSGLTMASWAQAGVRMEHGARAQYRAFPKVDVSALRPGDLVFYGSPIHHVSLYVGGGKVVDSPETGEVVQLRPTARGGNSPIAGAVRPS